VLASPNAAEASSRGLAERRERPQAVRPPTPPRSRIVREPVDDAANSLPHSGVQAQEQLGHVVAEDDRVCHGVRGPIRP
jgi:hypothetical protein